MDNGGRRRHRTDDEEGAGSNVFSQADGYSTTYCDPLDLENVDFSDRPMALPRYAQEAQERDAQRAREYAEWAAQQAQQSASPHPSVGSHGSLANRPSPAPSTPGSSRNAPVPPPTAGPSRQQGPPPFQESGKHHKRPRRDGSSGSSSSGKPEQQRQKYSHPSGAPAYIQDPLPQTTQGLQGMSLRREAPVMGGPAGGPMQPVQYQGGGTQHPYVQHFEQNPANLARFRHPQMGGYAPQPQAGSSAQAYGAPVINLTGSPGATVNPADLARGPGGGGGFPAQTRGVGSVQGAYVPVAAPEPPRPRHQVQWTGDTFRVGPRSRNWTAAQYHELQVFMASFKSWKEAEEMGQERPGGRSAMACQNKWAREGRNWTDVENQKIWAYMTTQANMSPQERIENWGQLVRWFEERGLSEDAMTGRMKLYARNRGMPVSTLGSSLRSHPQW